MCVPRASRYPTLVEQIPRNSDDKVREKSKVQVGFNWHQRRIIVKVESAPQGKTLVERMGS
jgi:hypothetical protein